MHQVKSQPIDLSETSNNMFEKVVNLLIICLCPTKWDTLYSSL